MSNSAEAAIDAFAFTGRVKQVHYPLRQGQRVMYEEEEAEIIRVTPLLVVKTKNRVVCGALHNKFKHPVVQGRCLPI